MVASDGVRAMMESALTARDRVGVQDFVLLENYTSEAAFIENLRKRFKENLIYVSDKGGASYACVCIRAALIFYLTIFTGDIPIEIQNLFYKSPSQYVRYIKIRHKSFHIKEQTKQKKSYKTNSEWH